MPYKDPVKQKEVQHQHYIDNKEKYKEATKVSGPKCRRKRTLWLQKIKSEMGCNVCGEKRGPCLIFHHRDPNEKEIEIADAVWKISKKRILEEIKKCDVMCANCHLLFHWEQNNGCIA